MADDRPEAFTGGIHAGDACAVTRGGRALPGIRTTEAVPGGLHEGSLHVWAGGSGSEDWLLRVEGAGVHVVLPIESRRRLLEEVASADALALVRDGDEPCVLTVDGEVLGALLDAMARDR